MADTDKLKPCPFCGDTFIIHYIVRSGKHDIKHVIGCNTLNCIGLHSKGNLFNSEEDAIKAWNRRDMIYTEDDIE